MQPGGSFSMQAGLMVPRLTSLDALDWLLQAVPRSSSHESFSGAARKNADFALLDFIGPPRRG
jgi:hypothetical protein